MNKEQYIVQFLGKDFYAADSLEEAKQFLEKWGTEMHRIVKRTEDDLEIGEDRGAR